MLLIGFIDKIIRIVGGGGIKFFLGVGLIRILDFCDLRRDGGVLTLIWRGNEEDSCVLCRLGQCAVPLYVALSLSQAACSDTGETSLISGGPRSLREETAWEAGPNRRSVGTETLSPESLELLEGRARSWWTELPDRKSVAWSDRCWAIPD